MIEPIVNTKTTDAEHALSRKEVANLPKTPLYMKAKNTTHTFLPGKSNEPEYDNPKPLNGSVTGLPDTRAKMRKKRSDSIAAQQECNLELAVSVLPARNMKPVSAQATKKLVANTIALSSRDDDR